MHPSIMEAIYHPIATANDDFHKTLIGVIRTTNGSYGTPFEIYFNDDENKWQSAYNTEAYPHIPTHWVEFREIPSTKKDQIINAYQRAFNSIDDLMEYRGMTSNDFKNIAASLTATLKQINGAETGSTGYIVQPDPGAVPGGSTKLPHFDSLNVLKGISKREQGALSEAAEKYKLEKTAKECVPMIIKHDDGTREVIPPDKIPVSRYHVLFKDAEKTYVIEDAYQILGAKTGEEIEKMKLSFIRTPDKSAADNVCKALNFYNSLRKHEKLEIIEKYSLDKNLGPDTVDKSEEGTSNA